MKLVSIIAVYLILISNANAVNCINPNNDYEEYFCTQKIFVAADKEINDAYKKLKNLLSEKDKKTLRIAELAWINKRNTECRINESEQMNVDVKCATDLTIKRTNFIKDRIRECASIGCISFKLKYVSVNEVNYLNKPSMDNFGYLTGRIEAENKGLTVLIDDNCGRRCSGQAGFFARKDIGLNEIPIVILQDNKPIMEFVAVRETSQQKQFGIKVIFNAYKYNISVSVKDYETGKTIFSSKRDFE